MTNHYVTEPYEEDEGKAWWIPKSAARLVQDENKQPTKFIPHHQKMADWKEQWGNGDVQFVSDLFEYTELLVDRIGKELDYGYRAEGRIKDLEKEVAELKEFKEWHDVAMQQYPEHHLLINKAWMKTK